MKERSRDLKDMMLKREEPYTRNEKQVHSAFKSGLSGNQISHGYVPRNPFAQREYLSSLVEIPQAPLSNFSLPKLHQRFDQASFTMKNGGKFRDDIRTILERSDSYWASKATEDTLRRYVPQRPQSSTPIGADSP